MVMENRKGNVQGGEADGAKDAAAACSGPVHSQVRRIQQEEEQVKVDPSPREVLEPRPVFRDLTRQPSRSPLGRVGRPISVGD